MKINDGVLMTLTNMLHVADNQYVAVLSNKELRHHNPPGSDFIG